jgi:hypothetical protein
MEIADALWFFKCAMCLLKAAEAGFPISRPTTLSAAKMVDGLHHQSLHFCEGLGIQLSGRLDGREVPDLCALDMAVSQ